MTSYAAREPVRWGFLGAGFVASRALAPAVHDAENAVLEFVASRDVVRAGALTPAHVSTDYETVCSASEVEVVYIALANNDHLPWVMRALESGKHVVCEKPLGLNSAEVATMAAASEASGRLLVEAVWNRWHPRTQRIVELLQNNVDLHSVQIESLFTFAGVPLDNYRMQQRNGGGALLDLGSYAVGMALAMLGPGDVGLESVQRRLADEGVDLTTSTTLLHAHGRAEVKVSFEEAAAQRLAFTSPTLSLRCGDDSGNDPAFTSWHAPSTLTVTRDGETVVEEFPACDPYRLMVEAVSARVRGDDAWVLPLSESVRVAMALDLIAGR
jgi:predicted dehydrogenase